MHPEAKDWTDFYRHFELKSGINLNEYKQPQMQRRILSMADQRGAKSLGEFWTVLSNDPNGIAWFQDKMAINVSELFRNPERFRELEEKILPDLLKRTQALSIWSAGCSYGAEAHSLAALLDAKFKGNHRILGTDIDAAALKQAQDGEFSEADMRAVPKELKEKYFTNSGGKWTALPSIKKYLTFKRGNLLKDPFGSNYDLIVCRNVVIYFTDEAKDQLYQRFYKALKPGGVLFVGNTERVFNHEKIGYSSRMPFYYQKTIEANQQWQNVS